MLGLNRKEKQIQLNLADWVMMELKRGLPEPEPFMSDFYFRSLETLATRLGPLAARPHCKIGLSVVDLNALVAVHAVQMLDASNYRAWTRAKNLPSWQRTLFQRALVIGTTMLLQSHYITQAQGSQRWSPFLHQGQEFFSEGVPKRFASNIMISGIRLEQGFFQHLFPEAVTGYGDPMAGLAALDSFSAPPDPENPMVSSLRRGLRKVILRYALDQSFEMKRWLMDWYPAVLAELPERGIRTEDGEEEEDTETKQETVAASGPQVAAMIRAGIEEGVLGASCPKAPFHAFDGVACVVWPVGVDSICHHVRGLQGDDLREMFIQEGWVYTEDGAPMVERVGFGEDRGGSKKIKATVMMAPLTDAGKQALIPAQGIPDNPNLLQLDPENENA
jgi:hypothetical protein